MSEKTEDYDTVSSFDEALARVFASVDTSAKDATNPHFGSKYSTLAAIRAACGPALTKEGFSWPQRVRSSKEGGLHLVHVETTLRRRGHSISSELAMPVGGRGTPQDIGSAITYARRYGLAAMVGVCPAEDDDGNAASAPRKQRTQTAADHVDELAVKLGALGKEIRGITGQTSGELWADLTGRAKITVQGKPTPNEYRQLIAVAETALGDAKRDKTSQ